MTELVTDSVVRVPLADAAAYLEAFLVEDDGRGNDGHAIGTTTAVRRLGRNSCEEVETFVEIAAELARMGYPNPMEAATFVTRYELSACAEGTAVRATIYPYDSEATSWARIVGKLTPPGTRTTATRDDAWWERRFEAFVARERGVARGGVG